MGRNHAAVGVGVFAVTAWTGSRYLGLGRLSAAQAALGTVVAIGSALAPDLDETHSLAGHANPLAQLRVFGGHRRRTHCLVAVAAVAVLALCCAPSAEATAGLVGVAACTGAGVISRTLRGGGWLLCVPFGVAAGIASYHWVSGGWWLVAAVAAPYASHLIGDGLTPGGLPWLLPFSRRRRSLHLFRTGEWVERLVVTPIVHLGAALAVLEVFAPGLSAASAKALR